MSLEKSFGTGWYEKLKPFLDSDEFKKIGRTLKGVEDLTPSFDRMFKAFELCPYENLKVVMLTNNSYEKEMHGVALSGKGKYDALSSVMFQIKEFQDCINLDFNTTLKKWSKQGVLMLNCDLSSVKGKTRVHLDLWEPFIEYIMKMLSEEACGIIYVLMGEQALKFRPFINIKQNDIIPLEHPVLAARDKRPWRDMGCFEYINRVSNLINDQKIKW